MSRRDFDDYDAQEWQDEHKRVSKERRKREAKQQRYHAGEEDPVPPGRPRPSRHPH